MTLKDFLLMFLLDGAIYLLVGRIAVSNPNLLKLLAQVGYGWAFNLLLLHLGVIGNR